MQNFGRQTKSIMVFLKVAYIVSGSLYQNRPTEGRRKIPTSVPRSWSWSPSVVSTETTVGCSVLATKLSRWSNGGLIRNQIKMLVFAM